MKVRSSRSSRTIIRLAAHESIHVCVKGINLAFVAQIPFQVVAVTSKRLGGSLSVIGASRRLGVKFDYVVSFLSTSVACFTRPGGVDSRAIVLSPIGSLVS